CRRRGGFEGGKWSSRSVLLRWQPDGREPEVLDRADHLKELINTEWLGHVTVRVERIAPRDVVLGRGRGEDDDRDLLELLVFLDLPEQVAPVPLGQVEIQEDDVGSRTCGVCPFAVEEGRRLQAIRNDVQIVANLAFAQSLSRQPHVAGIVLYEENFHSLPADSVAHGACPLWPLGSAK